MSTPREKFFVCTFTSRSRRISRQLRAWDECQAALQFREVLEEEGVKARGSISVADPSGHQDQPHYYEPVASA